jgi:hypothetical protein
MGILEGHRLDVARLSVVSAIISVALPIYDVPRQVESMVEVNEKWSQLVNDYEEIWTARNSISEADYREGVRKAKAIEAELSKKVARLPHDDVELGRKRTMKCCKSGTWSPVPKIEHEYDLYSTTD